MGAGTSAVRTPMFDSQFGDSSPQRTPIHFSHGGTHYEEDFMVEDQDFGAQDREELRISQLGGAPLGTQPDE